MVVVKLGGRSVPLMMIMLFSDEFVYGCSICGELLSFFVGAQWWI